VPRAFRTSPNGAIDAASDLGSLGGAASRANGVNNLGQVTGAAYVDSSNFHAFRTQPDGTITSQADLGTLGGPRSTGLGINNLGQVVGYAYITRSIEHAFRTTATGLIDAAADLGTLGGSSSIAWAINDSGQVVGSAETSDGQGHAFRTAPGGAINAASDLGTLGDTWGEAFAINSKGQTVGTSGTPSHSTDAFFVDVTGGMQDLNDFIDPASGWHLSYAYAINDADVIAGTGSLNGQFRGFVLTIPEPTSVVLPALIGYALLRRWRWRCCSLLSLAFETARHDRTQSNPSHDHPSNHQRADQVVQRRGLIAGEVMHRTDAEPDANEVQRPDDDGQDGGNRQTKAGLLSEDVGHN
jgi:probable HAF family extracellular repeat protein